MYHRNPKMQFKVPEASHLKAEIQADSSLEGLAETNRTLCKNILQADKHHAKYTSGKEITFDIGDKV
jgi:hypothetical protein